MINARYGSSYITSFMFNIRRTFEISTLGLCFRINVHAVLKFKIVFPLNYFPSSRQIERKKFQIIGADLVTILLNDCFGSNRIKQNTVFTYCFGRTMKIRERN